MDYTLMPSSPAVLHANHYQFAAHEHISHGPVMSCMQVWCRSGRGDISVAGERFSLVPGRAILMPWRHRVAYHPDGRDPFLLSGIHVVPAAASTVTGWGVAHDGSQWDGHAEGRHPLGTIAHALELPEHPALAHLSEYVVATFTRAPRDDDQRPLARMLLQEWSIALSTTVAGEPLALTRARRFILDHLDRRPDRGSLARAAAVSPATLQRLCARHLGISPVAWAQRLRIDAAKPLIAGSGQSIAELAARFGFCDAFHFSRAFKRYAGMAPALWRRKHALM